MSDVDAAATAATPLASGDANPETPASSPAVESESESDHSKAPLTAEDVRPEKRGCTDIPMCLVFVAALVMLWSVDVAAFARGDPRKFLHPLDHSGASCGLGDLAEFPYIYYPAKQMLPADAGEVESKAYYLNPLNLAGFCTSECPTQYAHTSSPRIGKCPEKDRNNCTWYDRVPAQLVLGRMCLPGFGEGGNSSVDKAGIMCRSAELAVEDVHKNAEKSLDALANKTHAELSALRTEVDGENERAAVDSAGVTFARTVEQEKTDLTAATQATKEKLIVSTCTDLTKEHEPGWFAEFITDLATSKDVLLISGVACILISILYLVLVSCCAGVIIWGSALVSICGFSLAGGYFWSGSIVLFEVGLTESASFEEVIAVICWILGASLALMIILQRKSLALAIAICKETGSFFRSNSGIILLPVVLMIVDLLWVSYWLYSLMAILSLAEVRPAENVTQEYDRFHISGALQTSLLYHLFLGLWVAGFIEGFLTVATAITVREWYFAPKEHGHKPRTHCSWFSGLITGFRYHCGSVAFGSLILAIVEFIRIIFTYLEKQATGKNNNCILSCVRGCIGCFLSCMNTFVRFLNFNAYLMIGVTGKNFCSSAWHAWKLTLANPGRFLIFHGVMGMVKSVGRLTILGGTLTVTVLITNKTIFPHVTEQMRTPWPALFCVAIIGYFVSGLCATVYSTSGAAMFFCFVCEEQTTGGLSPNAPDGLKALVDEHEKLSDLKMSKRLSKSQ